VNPHKFEKRSPFEKSFRWLSQMGIPSNDEKEEKQVVFFDQLLHKVWTEQAAKSPTRKLNPKSGPARVKKLSSYDKALLKAIIQFKRYMNDHLFLTNESKIRANDDIFRLRFVTKPTIDS
jgi:hypothetical protein